MKMMHKLATITFAIFTGATVADTQSDIVSWVRSKGGSFSDKLEIRKFEPDNPKSYLGVFTTDDIKVKESLFTIPQSCYIQVFDTAEDSGNEVEDQETPYYNNLCKLSHKLMGEMNLGDSSEYAPYVAYLKTQKKGQLPVNWSKAGKDIMRKIAIPGSPMVDWIDENFKQRNCIGNDLFEEHMVEMTVQRCFDTALIPIWDMVNHDNGRINTENDSMYEKEGMKVRAARDLKAGEEIFATYDNCVDCNDVNYYWGTPEILKDFGFVENYPHRWVFNQGEIWFEVYKDDDDEFEAYFGDEAEIPNEAQVEFLQKELDRLYVVEETLLDEQGNVPEKEWQIILGFHEAAVTDIEIVIEEISSIRSGSTENEL